SPSDGCPQHRPNIPGPRRRRSRARWSRTWLTFSGHERNDFRPPAGQRRPLEGVAELEEHVPALRAVADIQAADRRLTVVHAQSEAVGRMEVAEVEIAGPRSHLACIDEHRCVKVRPNAPA